MAVTRYGRMIRMTAQGDAVAQRLCVDSIVLEGTGMTVDQQNVVSETDANAIISKYNIEAATVNVELMPSPATWVDGIQWTTKPAAGTAELIIRVR